MLRSGKVIYMFLIRFKNYPLEDAQWMQETQLKDHLVLSTRLQVSSQSVRHHEKQVLMHYTKLLNLFLKSILTCILIIMFCVHK